MSKEENWARFYELVGRDNPLKSLNQMVPHLLKCSSQPLDTGASEKILKIVNSPAVGLPYPIQDVSYAAAVLGKRKIRDIAVGTAIYTHCQNKEKMGFQIWKHSFCCGRTAEILAETGSQMQSAAFAAGLLHDLGKILLYSNNPSAFQTLIEHWKDQKGKLRCWEVEKKLFGITHTEIGAMAGILWNLPKPICHGILDHHTPKNKSIQNEGEYLSLILHLSDFICWTLNRPSVTGPNPFILRKPENSISHPLLTTAGINPKIFPEIVEEIKKELLKTETTLEWIKMSLQHENIPDESVPESENNVGMG